MASATVRNSRGVWIADISTTVGGKRKRTIKTFGAGPKAKRAAESYCAEIAPQVAANKYLARQSMSFSDLWEKFKVQELSTPERRESTVTDYLALARLYLLPRLGSCLLADVDVELIMQMKSALQADPGAKASGKSGTQRPLSARSVAKILTLGGTVWRYGRRIGVVDGSPFADVKKPKATKRVPYILDAGEIAKLREALDVSWQRLLVELTITTGLRSGEVRGLCWDSIDVDGKRLFVEQAVTRRGEQGATKTESSVRPVPLPAYLIPDLKRWKLACPITPQGFVFPGEPDAFGKRGAIDADVLLRHVLRRALRKAGLPPLRFHDLRHLAGSFMHEAGVPLKRAQEILGHASERTTLAVYTHSMRRQHDDSADKIAMIAGLVPRELGDKRETCDDLESANLAQVVEKLAPWVGLEPTTNGLTERLQGTEGEGNVPKPAKQGPK